MPDIFEILPQLIDNAEQRYAARFLLSPELDRKLVSFQANKNSPIYRLFKYKEGFSAALIGYFIEKLHLGGPILDPFSGTGTTSIVSASKNIPSTGIELLPIGNLIARSRLKIAQGLSAGTLQSLQYWKNHAPWGNWGNWENWGNGKNEAKRQESMQTLRITKGAYPQKTKTAITQYLAYAGREPEPLNSILKFALCAILEEVSFTRKDGQFLRWDHRSGRRQGKTTFNKGPIHPFQASIQHKLSDIIEDASHSPYGASRNELFSKTLALAEVQFVDGSCLHKMQELESGSFEAIITSPPYCNRYDYTRTYALELAALGVDEKGIADLRQTMLSCTVENREKDLLRQNRNWSKILAYCASHELLSAMNQYFRHLKDLGKLNNNGIPRMISGYFNEIACVIYESARLLRERGYMLMVNDNVRYAGVCIPVDAILADIAAECGLETQSIMVLPSGKGNSSQQMGAHGRSVLRKCVYVWRKR